VVGFTSVERPMYRLMLVIIATVMVEPRRAGRPAPPHPERGC
jgi:hypothetical protein